MTKGETQIAQLITAAHYRYKTEYSFIDLKGGRYRYDFYLPDLNGGTLIEFDGQQHFKQITKFQPTRADFLRTIAHDRQKNLYALVHKIPLYRIPYYDIDKLTTFNDLFKSEYLVTTKYHNDNLRSKLH